MLYLQRCHEDTELPHGRNKPCCLYFSRVTSWRLWAEYLNFQESRWDLQLAQKKAAFPASTHSAWMVHVQPTQAQDVLPGDTLLPVLVLRLLWYRIFSFQEQFAPVNTEAGAHQLPQQMLAADSSADPSWWGVASVQHRWHCQAALLLFSFFFLIPKPSNDRVRANQIPALL